MDESLEIYIHIPFCVSKCHYCDFLSFPASGSLMAEYIDQLIAELISGADECHNRSISSIYIGGGTPSVLKSGLIERIMAAIYGHYHVDKDAEITIEANPSSAMGHKFQEYKAAGINRLSLGLQSADERELRMLGRVHSYGEFLKAYETALKEGLSNINVDLMAHIPLSTPASWQKTLKNVLMLKPRHISIYTLAIEEGTVFYELRDKGLLTLPGEEESEAIDSYTKELMSRAGYTRYEFSNYALPGYESRHNIGYWTGTEYRGFGLGASSYYSGTRWKNTSDMETYLGIDFGADGSRERLRTDIEKQSRRDMMEEFMYLGLRLTRGVSGTEFKRRFGAVLEQVFGEPLTRYTRLGLIEADGDRYRLTERGIDVSNRILCDFLLH